MENKTKGSGLIFAVVLLFVILGMVVTLSSVTVLETKMNQKTKSSVGAFYNSESGVEWALNKISTSTGSNITDAFSGFSGKVVCPSGFGCELYLLDDQGKVISNATNPDGSARLLSDIKAVRSIGTQGDDTQRAIEAAVAAGDVVKYQIACSSASATGQFFTQCCRIDTGTGVTTCKQSYSSGGGWYDDLNGNPWPL